jgi:Tetratricopeptide repeat
VTDRVEVVATPAERRSTDLTLARLHLRTGSLALARAEFETLAGRGALDDDALVDLADVRWRTGDLVGAGAMATSALDRGVAAPVAMIIAAEAAFARGRPGEARRLATRAMAEAGGTLDALFAGMPRSPVWPSDPAEPAPSAATLFGDDHSDTAGASGGETLDDRPRPETAHAPPGAAAVVSLTADPAAPGLWDEDAEAVPAGRRSVDPAAMLDAGLRALAGGDQERAAMLLGVAVRIGPHVAPTIVDATIDADAPALLLVRGDALRATGRETEAAETYAAAAGALRDASGAGLLEGDSALQSGPTESNPQ